jgi:hypothetical protein
MICESTDFIFPMQADIFYPIVEQGAYGDLKKTWILDRTIACNFSHVGSAAKEEVTPNVNITQESLLSGRSKTDIRISTLDSRNSITNVVISNIKDKNGNLVYLETSGIRSGKATLFEIASIQPFLGPFGSVEYYNILIRRSENQAVDL